MIVIANSIVCSCIYVYVRHATWCDTGWPWKAVLAYVCLGLSCIKQNPWPTCVIKILQYTSKLCYTVWKLDKKNSSGLVLLEKAIQILINIQFIMLCCCSNISKKNMFNVKEIPCIQYRMSIKKKTYGGCLSHTLAVWWISYKTERDDLHLTYM